MAQDYQILMFYIPCPTKLTAEALGKAAVIKNLAACYNLVPINSFYPWEEKLISDQEVALILKTKVNLETKLTVFIDLEHEYQVPCIARWKVNVNKAYFEWIIKNTKEC